MCSALFLGNVVLEVMFSYFYLLGDQTHILLCVFLLLRASRAVHEGRYWVQCCVSKLW